MHVTIRRTGRYREVAILSGDTIINLGMLNDEERDALAETLLYSVLDMGPSDCEECNAWLVERLEHCGMSAMIGETCAAKAAGTSPDQPPHQQPNHQQPSDHGSGEQARQAAGGAEGVGQE